MQPKSGSISIWDLMLDLVLFVSIIIFQFIKKGYCQKETLIEMTQTTFKKFHYVERLYASFAPTKCCSYRDNIHLPSIHGLYFIPTYSKFTTERCKSSVCISQFDIRRVKRCMKRRETTSTAMMLQ